MDSEDKKLLRAMAKDIAVIKTQIVNLRIKVAYVSATVAFITVLVFHVLSDKPAHADQQPARESKSEQSYQGAQLSPGRPEEAGRP